jgi:hypothetical protein
LSSCARAATDVKFIGLLFKEELATGFGEAEKLRVPFFGKVRSLKLRRN